MDEYDKTKSDAFKGKTMQKYEYKVVPAPNRPKRFKGVKGNNARFAEVLAESMNALAKEGWEYLRAESLPVEEKPGLLKARVESYHSLLIFRRIMVDADQPAMAGYIEDQSGTFDEPAAPETVRADSDQELPAEPPMTSEYASDVDSDLQETEVTENAETEEGGEPADQDKPKD